MLNIIENIIHILGFRTLNAGMRGFFLFNWSVNLPIKIQKNFRKLKNLSNFSTVYVTENYINFRIPYPKGFLGFRKPFKFNKSIGIHKSLVL